MNWDKVRWTTDELLMSGLLLTYPRPWPPWASPPSLGRDLPRRRLARRKLPYSYQFDPMCDVSFRATVCYRMPWRSLKGPFVPSKPWSFWSLYARREVLELVGTSIFVLLWAVPRKLSSRKSLIALVEAQQLFWFVLFLGEPSILHPSLCDWECLDVSRAAFTCLFTCFHVLNEVPGLGDLDLIFDWCNL